MPNNKNLHLRLSKLHFLIVYASQIIEVPNTSITVSIVGKGQRKWCGTSCYTLIFIRDYWRKLESTYIEEDLSCIIYRVWELKQAFNRIFPSQSLIPFPNKKKKENADLLILYGQQYDYSLNLLKAL